MLTLRKFVPALASAVVFMTAAPAWAGWQGVFQVCCHSCSTPAVSGYYAADYGCCDPCPCPCPCPQVVAKTNYVQRCYYQPVVTYKSQAYYEAVTSYRTSYYYEPITCYRYTCCYDPCTCCYRRVATPYTSYRLRSQCCPVTSWVQRCCYVPVTTYQKCCYWEAQTCYTLVDPCANGVTTPAVASPAVPAVTETPSAPGVQEYRAPAVPAPNGSSGSPLYDRSTPTPPPEGSGSSLRQGERWKAPAAPKAPVVPKYDRITFDTPSTSPSFNVSGQVVTQSTNYPKAGARLLFVSEAATGRQETATTDDAGRFRLTLATGGWLVYVRDEQGRAIFQSRVNVKENESQQVRLVSR